jgi:hypothetical protein
MTGVTIGPVAPAPTATQNARDAHDTPDSSLEAVPGSGLGEVAHAGMPAEATGVVTVTAWAASADPVAPMTNELATAIAITIGSQPILLKLVLPAFRSALTRAGRFATWRATPT